DKRRPRLRLRVSTRMRAKAAYWGPRRWTRSGRRWSSCGRRGSTWGGAAWEQWRGEGFDVAGPLPADTLFVAARRGDFDGVVTMYHDQGQIAMKLLGFASVHTLAEVYTVDI